MTARTRILAFGACALATIAGLVCAFAVAGLAGQLLAIILLSLGLGGAVLLVFLEVGLSEDRDRAREEARRERRRAAREHPRPPLRSHFPRWPRRPS